MSVKQRVQAKVWIVVALAVATVLLVGLGSQSFAQSGGTANTLKVSPVRTDIEIEPGSSKVVNTTVTNLTNAPITVRPIENDFVAGDERGTPALILDENEYAPTHSLKRFLTPISDVTIPAGKAETISVEITVPKDAQAGGYFGAIRFASAEADSGGQVNLSPSVASLILLTVPGDFVEKLDLTDFDIQQGGKSGSFFNSSNDLQASVRFENKGNIQIGPFGKVSVKKGDKVVYEADFNTATPRDMVLPDGARRWDIPLKKIGSFGRYTVSGTFTYGQKNETVEINKSFWVVPTGVIIATVAGILIIVGLIVGIGIFLRGYKRRILRKHGTTHNKE